MSAILILALIGGTGWLAVKKFHKPPVVSTGPEMDRVLMEKYESDVRKYQAKAKSWEWGQQVSVAAGGVTHRSPPKPPARPRLSTDA